jgi:DNA-binding HxlR family transcriptional regulator
MSTDTRLTCPINRAVAAIADKWKILLILTLEHRTVRFGELLSSLDGIAPKVMSRQLRSLEADGLVRRVAYAEVPPRVEYSLTRSGRTLLPILIDLQRWVSENADQLSPHITGEPGDEPAPLPSRDIAS